MAPEADFHDGIISEVLRSLKEYYNEDAKNKEGTDEYNLTCPPTHQSNNHFDF